jgi:phage anti-repressor protein
MSESVYNVVPLLLEDGSNQHHFQLKLSESTQSVRLEGSTFRRSIFIGKKAFNRLFRLLRNEYGFIVGKIFYADDKMKKGTATSADNHHYHFTIDETQQLKVILEDDNQTAQKLTATIPVGPDELNAMKQYATLIPSVLAAILIARDEKAVA